MNSTYRIAICLALAVSTAPAQEVSVQKVAPSAATTTWLPQYSADGASVCFVRGPDMQEATYCAPANATQLGAIVSPPNSETIFMELFEGQVYIRARTNGIDRVYRADTQSVGTAALFSPHISADHSVFDWKILPDIRQAVFSYTSPQGGSAFAVNLSGPPSIVPLAPNLPFDDAPAFIAAPGTGRILFFRAGLFSVPLNGSPAVRLTPIGTTLANESPVQIAGGRAFWLANTASTTRRAYSAPVASGGIPDFLNIHPNVFDTYKLRVSGDGRFACFVETFSGQGRLTCWDFEGGGSPRDIGLYQDEFFLVVLSYSFLDDNRTLISHSFLNDTVTLIQAEADQSGSISQLTGPGVSVEVNTPVFIPETGKVLFQATSGPDRSWFLLQPGSISVTELISEPSTERTIEFLGYSERADRYVFIYDANPFPAVQPQIIAVSPDGTQQDDISSTFPPNTLEYESVRPRFAADGRSIVYGDFITPLSQPIETRIIRADLVTGERTVLAAFPSPAAEARGLLSLDVSPTDPDGVLVTIEDAPGGQTAAYITYGDPDYLFGDNFEN